MASDEKAMLPADSAAPSNRRVKRRRLIIIGSVMGFIAIALAVGLGVGLTVGRPINRDTNDTTGSTITTSPSPSGNSQIAASVWKPQAGLSWQYDLRGAIPDTSRNGIDVYDIDLFDNSAETIASLQQQGAKVVCYFSAGSYEDWRADKDKFQESDLGTPLAGWPGERWLKLSSSNVRKIMEARLDVAVQKKCDGVDPDNVDGFDNENGLDLTEQDSIDYMNFLTNAAHQRNLAIGLKNSGSIIPNVLNSVEFSVNEQCHQFNECETYRPFIDQGKPVFNVEYPKGDDTNNNISVAASQVNPICDDTSSKGFSTIIKNMDLDQWIQTCPQS